MKILFFLFTPYYYSFAPLEVAALIMNSVAIMSAIDIGRQISAFWINPATRYDTKDTPATVSA